MPKSKPLHLTARDEAFPCGYGPRSIRLSQDRRHLFVGCKDGSVTWIDLALAGNPETRRQACHTLGQPQDTGVRSICDLANDWLLLGRDEGGVVALGWRQQPGRYVPLTALAARCEGGIGYVGRWEPGVFVVSPRRQEAILLRLDKERPSGDLPFTLVDEPGRTLPGVLAMSGFARVGDAERLLVCKTGALWWHAPGRLEPLDHLWRHWGLERPGFVFGDAVVRAEPEAMATDPGILKEALGTGHDRGIYLSTDEGVFLLRPLSERNQDSTDGARPPFRIDPVFLPGITSTCLAVTHAVEGKNCLLWVSDTEGTVHLFWSRRFWGDADAQTRTPVWHRSGLLERRFPVMRAVASWTPGEHKAVVGQACRDDRILVSWYRSQEAGELKETSAATDVLSWGTIELLRRAARPEKKAWWPEALVADHIEKTGTDPDQLRRFLRNPGVDLACSALEEIFPGGLGELSGDGLTSADHLSAAQPSPDQPSPDDAAARRAAQAITFWNHALLGTVHRRLADATRQDYLGIIRWLRRLGESALLQSQRPGIELLRAGIEGNIQYARKWGVFGSTYASRPHALCALAPLTRQQTPDRRLDRLVYESLIFRRRMDLDAVLPAPASHALPPWDLRYLPPLEPDPAEHVAVSWADGGTVYRRGSPAERWENLTAREGGAAASDAPLLSGRILLGACGDDGGRRRPYLLSAPAQQEGRLEKIELCFLDGDARPERSSLLEVDDLLPANARREAKESVFSLLALGSGRVAVGLQGTLGGAPFGLLRVTRAGELQAIRPDRLEPFATVYPESKTLQRNPVWSLACHAASDRGITLLLGCNDGQIWKVRIAFDADGFEEENRLPVCRLGAPVTALACRCVAGGKLRVFAGLADGTLIAFQGLEQEIAFQGLEQERHYKERYATLWATREQSRVRTIHCFSSALLIAAGEPLGRHAVNQEGGAEPGSDQDGRQLVLAVTQQGTAVMVLDREQVEQRAPADDRLRRLKLPGEQLGRLWLGTSVFGSALLPAAQESPKGIEPALARLIVAPAAGGPRVLTLHHPKLTPARQTGFSDLRREWLQQLRGTGERVQGYLLRRPETTYAASPALPAVLVRWILPFEPGKEAWEARCRTEGPGEDEGPCKQWLPGHLRPLVDLDTAWRKGRPLRGLLKAALLAAREVNDRALFKEIIEAALSRANHQLYQEALAGGALGFARQFADLIDDLEEVKGAWEGMAEGLDSRMRITVAKSLLDGDTLWSLSRRRILAEAGTEDPAAVEEPLGKAMQGRIDVIHRFLGKGDLLLALETLRAANRALLRLCRRLVRGRPKDWTEVRDGDPTQRGGSHLHWPTISAFYQTVGDFAARVAHAKGTLGEVAAHEVCRAYALGILACPSEMVRLAIWLTEADLPIDVGDKVEQQLALLGDLLGKEWTRMPAQYRALLRIALRVPQAGRYEESLFFPRKLRRDWAQDAHRVGTGNAEIVRARRPFDEIIVWLHDVARQLADDAGAVDLPRRKSLYENIAAAKSIAGAAAAGDDANDQMRHSRAFWKKALEDLDRQCMKFPRLFPDQEAAAGDGARRRPVRPELVLFSGSLEKWCERQRDEIRRRRGEHQIFAPMSSLYDEALALVERTAGRFREGAAVQKSLVLGVLSHGLLEMLDEHLLEVWEVAQALDPRRAWEQEESEARGERPASTAACFAEYLLQRALKAEVIPKNLRSLQGLLGLDPSPARQSGRDRRPQPRLNLAGLLCDFEDNFDWVLDTRAQEAFARHELDRREHDVLHLTLTELAQNDRVHGMAARLEIWGGNSQGADWRPRVEVGTSQEMGLKLEFYYPYDEKAFDRARKLWDSSLQGMIVPREDPRFPSHGTGLYLANLAAGAVGWKLELEEPEAPQGSAPGTLRFTLRDMGRVRR